MDMPKKNVAASNRSCNIPHVLHAAHAVESLRRLHQNLTTENRRMCVHQAVHGMLVHITHVEYTATRCCIATQPANHRLFDIKIVCLLIFRKCPDAPTLIKKDGNTHTA